MASDNDKKDIKNKMDNILNPNKEQSKNVKQEVTKVPVFNIPVKKEDKSNIKSYPLYIEDEKKKQIQAIAKKTKRSMNEVINMMIDFCLEHMR